LVQKTNEQSFDLSTQSKGIYFIKISTNQGIGTYKLILE